MGVKNSDNGNWLQSNNLGSLLESVNRALEIPFYSLNEDRSKAMRDFLALSNSSSWQNLPFLTKRQLQEDQQNEPPYGSLVPPSKHKLIRRTHRTSGTTGVPLFVCYSESDLQSITEIGGKAFRNAGVGRGDRIIHCLNYCMWAGGVTDHLSLERAGANVIPFGVGNTVELLQTIHRLQVCGISCTPSYLSRLEEVLKKEMGLPPSSLGLRYALCGGEGGLQDLDVRRVIEEKWQMRIVDANYGMAEAFSLFGGECKIRDGLHFHGEGYLFPELIDSNSEKSIAWKMGSIGELVISNLGREIQPLIRYRTGDIIKIVSTDECRCGEVTPRFMVVGRADQMVVIRGINVFPGAIKSIIAKMPNWLSGEFRILVPSSGPITKCILRIEKQTVVDTSDDSMIKRIESEIENGLHVKAEIQLVEFGSLARTAGKTNYLLKENLW